MDGFTVSPIAQGAKFAVVKAVSNNLCTPESVEDMCINLLVESSGDSAEGPRLARVIEDLVGGAMAGAGAYEPVVAYGAVRGAVLGGRRIGIDPVSAAIIAVETAATAWSDDGNPILIEAAVEAAMSAAEQIGPPVPDDLYQWLDECVPFAILCLKAQLN